MKQLVLYSILIFIIGCKNKCDGELDKPNKYDKVVSKSIDIYFCNNKIELIEKENVGMLERQMMFSEDSSLLIIFRGKEKNYLNLKVKKIDLNILLLQEITNNYSSNDVSNYYLFKNSSLIYIMWNPIQINPKQILIDSRLVYYKNDSIYSYALNVNVNDTSTLIDDLVNLNADLLIEKYNVNIEEIATFDLGCGILEFFYPAPN